MTIGTFSPIKTKLEHYSIPQSIYRENFQIVIVPEPKQARMLIDTTVSLEVYENAEAITFSQDGTIIMWLRKLPSSPKDWGVVHHELLHATYATLSWVGIELSNNTEEAYAYLLEYYTTELYKKIGYEGK